MTSHLLLDFNLIILGEVNAGKTSIIHRFTKQSNDKIIIPTNGK